MRSLLYDIEGNGLLRKHRGSLPMDRIHCLVMRDAVTRETFRFRRCEAGEYDFPIGVDADGKKLYERRFVEAQDTIAEGVEMLRTADRVIGHNVINFDNKAIQIVFPDWVPTGQVVDTLVLARMLVPDIKNGDFNLHKAGRLPGWLIGSHSLDAWGYRLGKHKGEYANDMIKRGLDPWAAWNPEQEDYCLTPDHKLLGTDLRWKAADTYAVGDTVLGFDEEGPGRRYRKAVIESVKYDDRPVFAVTLSNGDVIKTTAEHRWLVAHKNTRKQTARFNWVETQNLRPGMTNIPKLMAVWDEDQSRDAGWLAGIFDGEGHCSPALCQLTIAQKPGIILDRILSLLPAYAKTALSQYRVKTGNTCQVVHINGFRSRRLEFLGTIRPERLIAKVDFNALGRVEARDGTVKVVSVAPLGVQRIIKIQTSTRTFVADGYPMHNCENDIDVTEILWNTIAQDPPPESAVALEQQIHDIVGQMEANGFFFDLAQAEKLADELRVQIESKSAEVVKSFGSWYKPKKKKIVKIQWEDPNGINAAKTYATPNTAWGEDYSRAVWGDMTFPKKTRRGYGANTKKKKPGVKPLPDVTEGCPFVAIERVQFNPRSRHHIIDRFTNVYGWTPETFTDAGSPSVDDPVLTKLIETIPEAGPLADILYMEKRYGQIYKGKASWINAYNPDTERIHPYTNTGGTVSGRCAHVAPNIAQVPAVQVAKIKDGKIIDGDEVLDLLPHEYITHGSKAILLGAAGGWGYECRSLFYTPEYVNDEAWVQVGVDLSGIEFRCLAERCAKYDGGELIQVVLSGDIHAINMASTGITDRTLVKRVLYGLMYGAQNWKLGHTIAPYASDVQKKRIGDDVRTKLMRGLPALKKVIDECQEQAEHGFLIGLDGRRLPARSRHSALNLRLQSDAAFVAKKWVCLTEEYAFEAGMSHGWRGDFAMLAFVHDEIETSVKQAFAQEYAALCVKAAAAAGEFFGFSCPIDAEYKIGHSWAEVH